MRASAAIVLGIAGHLVELRLGDRAGLLVADFIEETQLFHHIATRIKQQAIRRQAIAPGAAGFLIVAFDVFWQIRVDDPAHVRFIDAHAEGDRGADDAGLIAQKRILIARAFGGFHSGVIGERGNPLCAEGGS